MPLRPTPFQARFVTACQQLLALAVVCAALTPALGVVSLDVVAQSPGQPAAGAAGDQAGSRSDRYPVELRQSNPRVGQRAVHYRSDGLHVGPAGQLRHDAAEGPVYVLRQNDQPGELGPPPAIGAWMIGSLLPTSSIKRRSGQPTIRRRWAWRSKARRVEALRLFAAARSRFDPANGRMPCARRAAAG